MESVFLAHPSSLQHDTGGHPERAARIIAIERELAARDWLGFERVSSPEVERDVLTAVHPEAYVATIERTAASGGGALDADTVISPGSFEAALHAAGGAVRMIELLLDGEAAYAFSAHRPPGHHATPTRAMGFCVFNNVAVAARFALDRRGLERVMILDWDVHHGNGTNDIFHTSDRVLFVSLHQSPLYPGTGPAGDVGAGPGEGFTVNLPVSPGTGDEEYLSLVEHVAIPLMEPTSRSWCWSRRGTTRTATTRWRSAWSASMGSRRWRARCGARRTPQGCRSGACLRAAMRSKRWRDRSPRR